MQFVLISEENRNNIDNVVYNKVANFGIKWNVEKNCTIAAAVHIWEELEKDLMKGIMIKVF